MSLDAKIVLLGAQGELNTSIEVKNIWVLGLVCY